MGKIMVSGDLRSRLTDLWNEFAEDEYLFEQWADAQFSEDPDPDMTPFEIHGNGFELGVRAAGRDVTFAELEGTVYFFFGTEEEVLARLDGLAASARRDLLAETVHEICEEAKSAGATSVRVAAMSSFEEDADQAEFEKVHHGDNLAPAVKDVSPRLSASRDRGEACAPVALRSAGSTSHQRLASEAPTGAHGDHGHV